MKIDEYHYPKATRLFNFMFMAFIFFSSILSAKSKQILENAYVKLNCKNDICKCKQAENFTIDSVEHHLKYNELKDTAILACMYHQLAIEYYGYENQQKAIQYGKRAIQIREQFDDGWLWKSHLNLANFYHFWSQYYELIKHAENANKLSGHPKRSKDSLAIFRLLADANMEIGELNKAILFSKKAITVHASIEEIRSATITYAEALVTMEDTFQIAKALDCLDTLENIFAKEKDSLNLIRVKNIFGKAYYLTEKFDKSIQYYDEALNLLEYEPYKAILSNNIGSTFTRHDKLSFALNYLKKALQINISFYESSYNYVYASNYENLGDYYIRTMQLDTALLYYQKALINLSNNFRDEDFFQNPNPKDSTLFIYSNPDMIRVLHLKANAAYQHYQQNNNQKYLTLANQTYQTAFDFHNKLQKEISTENSRLFQAKNIVPYIENALNVTYQLQENGQDVGKTAFRFMEKNKATVLLQSMNETDALQFANLPDSLLEQEKDLKIAIAFHNKQLNDAIEYEDTTEIERLNNLLFEERQKYSRLIQNLENNYPDYYRLKYQQNQTQLSDVQNLLDDKTALLEYFVGDSTIYLLSIQKQKSQLYQINKPKNWQQIVDGFLSTLNPEEVLKDEYTNELFTSFTQNAYSLYQNLLQLPLKGLSKSITKLQIIPDAELNYIPFELLLTNQTNSKEVDYRKLPYLLKEKTISYAYSAALLLENTTKAPQTYTYNYAGFAPDYKNSKYEILTSAKENVKQVTALLEGKAYLENQATDLIYKDQIGAFKTFQLAMHGILDDKNPLNSKLIFTKTNDTTDFELHAYELYNMNIPAQLGVLSACETGTGKEAKGEGIMSLSRAFTYAGCNSLVMSLWKIEDQATADIVYSFFKQLKKGKAKDEALQQAKLDYLENASALKTHPIYWAGLVQSGNVDSIDFGGGNFWWVFLLIPIVVGLGFGYFRNKNTSYKQLNHQLVLKN